jgi:spore coat-associated protein N
MRKIAILSVAVLVIIGLVSAGTYAYFSDTESSTNNVLTAGTLDLNIDGGNVAVTTFTASAVAPGDSGSGSSTLANVGTMAGELDITTSAVTNTPGAGGTEYEGGSGELGANAQIAMYIDVDQSGTWNAGDIGLQSNGAMYSFPTALNYDAINNYASETWNAVETMGISASDNIVVNWQVPAGAGNDIQGDSVRFDISFILEQAAAD